MKSKQKYIILLFFLLSTALPLSVWAIPAHPQPVKIEQADGTVLTLYLHGDEFNHYMTTEDGYTVVRNDAGQYVYAASNEKSKLSASQYLAKDIAFRSPEEETFLAVIPKRIRSKAAATRGAKAELNKHYVAQGLLTQQRVMPSNFKGVIILAQFQNKNFLSSNINEEITSMVNSQNYTENGATGSVRDYFYDNSLGKFDPQFTIVGPVTLDYPQEYAQGADNGQALVRDACEKADPLVDFSQFDLDGDGRVDMIYVIFAGHGSNVSGNDPNLIWPHAYALGSWQVQLDGVYCNRYACSTELQGGMNSTKRDGIGTICHEFGHVLGLPDFYDTDYEENGLAPHPGNWSVMASGSYLNNSYTPCGYSAFERYALGWASPVLLEENNTYTLEALNLSNKAYRINSAVSNEFFLLENRQQSGWDKYLPGHGMLVFRVDSTNTRVWQNNTINNNPDHVYYELLRADNQDGGGIGNPFPGLLNVTTISDETTPGLRSWTGAKTGVKIEDIAENGGGISFGFSKPTVTSLVENFEDCTKPEWASSEVTGKYASWKLNNAIVAESIPSQAGNGNKAALGKRGLIEMTSDVSGKIQSVGFYVAMQTSVATYKIEYSMDQGKTWERVGDGNFTINSNQKEYRNYEIDKEGTFRLRITIVSPAAAYIDDITINKTGGPTSVEQFDADEAMSPYTRDGVLHYYIDDVSDRELTLYDLSGKVILTTQGESGWNTLPLSELRQNFILLQQGNRTYKLYVR